MLVNNYMHNLNNSMDRLSKLQTQLALNRKFASISVDRLSAIYSMQASFRLDRLERYQKSVDIIGETLPYRTRQHRTARIG